MSVIFKRKKSLQAIILVTLICYKVLLNFKNLNLIIQNNIIANSLNYTNQQKKIKANKTFILNWKNLNIKVI